MLTRNSRRRRPGAVWLALGLAALLGRSLPANAGEIGSDFQISAMSVPLSFLYYGYDTRVAYNSSANEYLVVWVGADDSPSLGFDELEIFGQRLDATTGLPVGTDDFRISFVGPDGLSDYFADSPAVAYNPVDNEYLVVWRGNRDFETEIYGQRLAADGTLAGGELRLSDMGIDGDRSRSPAAPAVAADTSTGQYLVVWSGDDDVDNELEIYGQRVSGAGVEVGTNDFRISDMGVDGASSAAAFGPDVAYNSAASEFLVVWSGDDSTAPLVDDEFEIFGQRIAATTGAEVGTNDFRISDMGPDGDSSYGTSEVSVVYNQVDNQYLVVWSGSDDSGGHAPFEQEIWGQRLDASGAEIGTNDFPISSMGPVGDTSYGGFSPTVAFDGDRDEYLVVWYGDDDTPPLSEGELEIFGQIFDASGTASGDRLQISDMDDFAETPAVAYASGSRQYLTVWDGSEDGLDQEIFGQRIGNCGGGTLEPGEECEAPFDDCCDPFTCTFKAASEICRAAGDVCDVAESCTGTSAECPADDVAALGTSCRSPQSICDVEEFCDGSSIACPADAVNTNPIECRATAGDCDVSEACDGINPVCPTDGFVAGGTTCRPGAGDCDLAEACTGSGPACPTDQFAGAEVTCRSAADVCDAAETCDNSGPDCPTDVFLPSTVECRGIHGVCDVAENCTGAGIACPTDGFAASGVCRPVVGLCDVADSCDGSGADCPTDVLVDAGQVCRSAAGDCDVVESCTGSDPQCPGDQLAGSSTVCRPVADVCDVAESCTGSAVDCPTDGYKSSGVECRAVAGVCDVAESCTGAAAACPTDAFAGGEVVCRPAVDQCDAGEACDGSGASCPTDQSVVDNTPCSDSDLCTTAEVCLSGVCTPSQIPGCDEWFVGYKAKTPETDAMGLPLNNVLPESFVVKADDVHLTGAEDDPENYVLTSSSGVLLTAAGNGGTTISEASYVRYRASIGPQTAGPAGAGGEFDKAAKHVGRLWRLDTPLGEIEVLSKRVASVLVPAGFAVNAAAPAAPETTHFLCYGVKATKASTDQTPAGKFAKDLQAFVESSFFDDCALDQNDQTPFPSTAVSGNCLFDMKKVVELCNPAAIEAAEPPRTTSASAIAPAVAATTESLLCYKPKLSSALANPTSAALAGGSVGQVISPKQSKHVPHELKRSNPVAAAPGSAFPAPTLLETKATDRLCIPASVLSVAPAR